MYRDPTCYVADVEAMIGASYRTAQRVIAKARKHYGLRSREKMTLEQMRLYLEKI